MRAVYVRSLSRADSHTMSHNSVSTNILRKVVIDGLLISGLVLCILATKFLWDPYSRGFFCGDESLMYPYHDDTVSVIMLRVVGLGLPSLAFLICEWAILHEEQEEVRCLGVRIPTWLRGFYCVLASFTLGVCFVELTSNFAKNIIGRLRPHFFQVCQPSVDCTSPAWTGRYVQFEEYHCTGQGPHDLLDMRRSFLSGHSSWAAYTMIYMALYLESRMRWGGTRVLRHTIQYTVVMLSWYTALSRVSDFKHHWSDVLAGYVLGIVLAVLVWSRGTDLVKKKHEHAPLPQNDITLITQQQTNTLSA